jgi:hypothetical protein
MSSVARTDSISYIPQLASNDAYAATLLVATGAVGFVASVAGFWLLLHLVLASVECE